MLQAVSPACRGVVKRRLLLGLALYCVFVAIVVLLPSASFASRVVLGLADLAGSLGAPAQLTVGYRVEFGLNALMVAPMSALGSLLWPTSNWRDWTAAAFVGSVAVELFQGLFLPQRSATFIDVCANTLGGLIGALGIAVALRVVKHRSRREAV